jgi:hypothetical protein
MEKKQEKAIPQTVFLSITIEQVKEGLFLHQKEYLESKLKVRDIKFGRPNLPEVEEGKEEPNPKEEREKKWYTEVLKKAQEEVGALQWLALKTRPDIAAITAVCASLQTRNPEKAVMWTTEIWRYLKSTSDMGTYLCPGDTGYKVNISADASFAPGGDRSRTGVVIRVAGAIVHWSSNRQSGAVMSAHEAELNAAVSGTKVGISIRNIVKEMTEEDAPMKLDQDNKATIRSILYEVTSWRTRHYALRAAGIRDLISTEGITVEHVKGVRIIADPLTKVLGKIKLIE